MKEREAFLNSMTAIQEANIELQRILEKLKDVKTVIEAQTKSLHLTSSERPNPPMYEFGHNGYFLCFNSSGFDINLEIGVLKVSLYEKSANEDFDYTELIHKQSIYRFDRDFSGNNGWSDHKTGQDFLTTDELVDKWVKQFITDIGKRKKKHS